VLTYIIRRLIGAVLLLFVVSAVVFSIFFLIPRLGGASADDLAGRYVGKTAGSAQIHQTAVKLGFTDPIYVQYGRFAKGIIVGQDFNYGPSGPRSCGSSRVWPPGSPRRFDAAHLWIARR
jgi:peptide/nickel transport system permease protein